MSDNVTAQTISPLINIIIPIITFIVGLLGKILWDLWQEKRRVRKDNLKIHFETINEEVVNKLYNMSISLGILHNELQFLSSEEEVEFVNLNGERIYKSQEPILEHYKFEEDDSYLSFEVHFPERAQEWKQLKSEALKLKGYCNILNRGTSSNDKAEYDDAKRKFSNDFFPLQNKFKDFAQRLNIDIETIGKYQVGTVFKYDKKCPICKKF